MAKRLYKVLFILSILVVARFVFLFVGKSFYNWKGIPGDEELYELDNTYFIFSGFVLSLGLCVAGFVVCYFFYWLFTGKSLLNLLLRR